MHSRADEPEAQARLQAFSRGLEEAGWAVGRNLRIDYRWSVGDAARLLKDAQELVAISPDVILAGVGATTSTLHQATRTVPVVSTRAATDTSRAWHGRAAMRPASSSSASGGKSRHQHASIARRLDAAAVATLA